MDSLRSILTAGWVEVLMYRDPSKIFLAPSAVCEWEAKQGRTITMSALVTKKRPC